jgi:hypothetical protein
MNFNEITIALQKRFPTLEIKCGSEFSKDYKPNQAIWLRNASSVPYTNKDVNPLSALDNGIYDNKNYDIDVYIKFDKWCNKKGWYTSTEEYTLMLYKISKLESNIEKLNSNGYDIN